MPSVRVWTLLVEGSLQQKPHETFQAVMTGLVNASWPRVCITRAFQDHALHPGSPGHWWLRKRGGRPSEFERAFVKAQQRVQQIAPNPQLAKHARPEVGVAVEELLGTLEQRLLDVDALAARTLLPSNRNRPFTRSVLWAFIEHAREHASLLTVDSHDGSLPVSASARCLALRLSCSHQAVSDVLRVLSTDSAPGEPAYTALLVRAITGRAEDAHVYRLDPRRLEIKRALTPRATEASLPQFSGETSGKEASGKLEVRGPDLRILAHEAFQPTVGTDGFSRTQGFLIAFVASNPGALTATELAGLSGLTDRGVRNALQPLTSPRSDATGLARRNEAGAYELVLQAPARLHERLDELARAFGRAGTFKRREVTFAEERNTFRARIG